ncbi:hypothetical protein GCM10008015_00190 [Flavobacterium palustre]|uniref:Glycosyltransferase family 1 protein n=1 Tax=Flavobacterium palustre TaxID=1476463 RepID=A0ABQ1H9G9_9FLAO|nr:glycosyltransferase family 1 protein [Flavobacterium palustre]GGA63270.1 hypothetical protein GCM10008015_00190 [Flavobacterium palustre]
MELQKQKKTVSIFFRSEGIDYSIERIFDSIIPKLDSSLTTKNFYVPYYRIKLNYIFKNLIYCKRNKSDVNHITGVIHYCSFLLPYSKTIITIHDLISVEQGRGLKKIFFWFFFFYLPIKKCKYVTCISESVRSSLIKYKCCDPSKIIVIPNPVSDSFVFTPKEFNNEEPRILHIGTRPNKNLINVIKALSEVPCHLIIVGKLGKLEEDLLKECKIKYTNKIDLTNEQIQKEYIECDIVSFPSVYEGFGVPILEGQAVGRPVLTSNILPMKAVAGENYFLIDPFDVGKISEGFKKLINNTDLRKELIELGLKNVEKYNVEAIAQMYSELYSKVLTSNN